MRFFKKFLSSVSNSNKKNDYARATLKYATNLEINKSKAIVCNNRGLAFKTKGEYDRHVSNYTKAHKIKTNNVVTVMNLGVAGLQHQRISVTFYRSYKSKTSLSISRS
jgi:hypothetical protein